MKRFVRLCQLMVFVVLPLTACQTQRVVRDNSLFMPRIGGDASLIEQTPLIELRQLQLISTNLVSALVQLPELKSGSTTLQVSKPVTVFGNTLLRALEDAGFGMQRVSADQGLNYVTYGKRFAETEAGPVTDFSVAVGDIEVRREYDLDDESVFPTSLLLVSGTQNIVDVELDDNIFTEQGGSGDTFISGVGGDSVDAPTTDISTVVVNDYDVTPLARRTSQDRVLDSARKRIYARESTENLVDLNDFSQLRRAVLIFNDKDSIVMGRGNKQAIRLLAQDFRTGDIFSITACTDADGKNDASQLRGIRVEEEFVGHGIEANAVQIEPCIRASYRHSSDDSPVAVSVVQYRDL